MIRRPPRSTRTDTLFPYTTLFRSRLQSHRRLGGALHLAGGWTQADRPVRAAGWGVRHVRDVERARHLRRAGAHGGARMLHSARCAERARARQSRRRRAAGALLEPRPRARLRSPHRSEEHTSELQALMRNSYAVFCLNKTKNRDSLVDIIYE